MKEEIVPKLFIALALLTLIALFPAQHVIAYVPGVAALREPYIALPSYVLPAVVKPGGLVNVFVRTANPVNVLEAYIYSILGSYRLNFESTGKDQLQVDPSYSLDVIRLTFSVPSNVLDGLYSLVIRSDGGTLWMPNSVIVDSRGGPRGVIRVAQLTDTHFGAEQGGYPNNFKHTRYAALLNTLIESLGINLVVYTGDLIDVGTDVRSYRDFFTVISQVIAPQLAITGNHNWAQVDSTKLLVERYYGRYVVPLRVWNITYGDFLFVGLDTREDGYPEMWQLDYLEKVVSANADKAVIVLMHHPLFTRSGEYRGKPEDVRGSMYSSWRELGWEQARRLLEMVERYKNIVAFIAGHVHRDADTIYYRSDGSKVYFITTTTANHGYPEGYYWGMKVLEISREGVKVVTPPEKEYKQTSGSVNTERFLVFEVRDVYNKAVSWFFNTTNVREFRGLLGNATLVFYLNKTVSRDSYKLYGDTVRVHGVKWYDMGLYYLAKVYANITGYGRLTIASYDDTVKPQTRIVSTSPREPVLGRTFVINIEAGDDGWGVERVTAEVRVNGILRGIMEAQRTMEPSQYRIILKVEEPGSYEITVKAIDLKGNIGEEKLSFQVAAPITETATTTPATTQVTQTTETPTKLTTPATQTLQETTGITETGRVTGIDSRILVVLAIIAVLIILAVFLVRRRA